METSSYYLLIGPLRKQHIVDASSTVAVTESRLNLWCYAFLLTELISELNLLDKASGCGSLLSHQT